MSAVLGLLNQVLNYRLGVGKKTNYPVKRYSLLALGADAIIGRLITDDTAFGTARGQFSATIVTDPAALLATAEAVNGGNEVFQSIS